MEPTLKLGQRVFADPAAYRRARPKVGDIVVFHPPAGAARSGGEECGVPRPRGEICAHATPRPASATYLKRIAAGPGDRITMVRGALFRNGRLEPRTHIRLCDRVAEDSGDCTFRHPYVVPRGAWFVLGDNRGVSDDSRFWGAVPQSWITGKIVRR
jgi:signal peptidase I